jgi:bifunctional non-homologous end joining protein LigD
MNLRTNRSRRDLRHRPEPDADHPEVLPARQTHPQPTTPGGRFVVHRHRARRLHYDLRLEIGGVLVSWAVPRGPTLDPAVKRLAVQVEDHPRGYFGFEGVIPAGQSGGGDVIVWDWGRWTFEPGQPAASEALRAGQLKLRLEGQKLHGGFVMIRTDSWAKSRPAKPKWLLIHRRDDAAQSGWDADDHPASVKTGRTNEEVAAGRRATRHGRPPGERPDRTATLRQDPQGWSRPVGRPQSQER